MAKGCWTGRSAGAGPRVLAVTGWIPGRERPSWVAGLGGAGQGGPPEESQTGMHSTVPYIAFLMSGRDLQFMSFTSLSTFDQY